MNGASRRAKCADHLKQMVQHLADPGLFGGIFHQREWRGLHDITIGMIERRTKELPMHDETAALPSGF